MLASAVLDLERELGQPLRDRAVELALVLLERLRVDVVAVQLLGLVAVGAVVRVEPLARLLDHVDVVADEQVELARDHLAEAGAAEDHASSRYSSRCCAAAASQVRAAR